MRKSGKVSVDRNADFIRVLDTALDIAETEFLNNKEGVPRFAQELSTELIRALDIINSKCSKASTGFTNIITGVTIKAVFKDRVDVRYHQVQIQDKTNRPAGFNFRGISEDIIYVWLSQHEFEGAKSGWQTRTFERPKPYTLDYDENIGDIKNAFLICYDQIETKNQNALLALAYLLFYQLKLREAKRIEVSIPNVNDVLLIAQFFTNHFNYSYKDSKGASRLPVLALYAIYTILINELDRYRDKKLKPLEAHSAADAQTGALGDIEVINSDGTVFEAIEVKHGIQISEKIVEDIKQKIRGSRIERYYILTTYLPCEPTPGVQNEIELIKKLLGCQVIANGVIQSIKYYLRLLTNPSDIFPVYAELLKSDSVITYEHKNIWNKITTGEL